MAAKKELNYNKAYEELTAIVTEIENNNLPLDILAEKIKYAGQLIQFCKEKLRHTETDFKTILKQLEEE